MDDDYCAINVYNTLKKKIKFLKYKFYSIINIVPIVLLIIYNAFYVSQQYRTRPKLHNVYVCDKLIYVKVIY